MLDRVSLPDQVAEELRRRILEGTLEPGSRLHEARLAAELGVSRTPVREALRALERERLVHGSPARGCSVARLEPGDACDLYEALALLEPASLRLAGVPGEAALAELGRRRRALGQVPSGVEWLRLDAEWHALLISGCPNRRLLAAAEDLWRHARRYESACVLATGSVPGALRRHGEVLAPLAGGALEGACAALEAGLLARIEPVLHWLQTAEHPGPSRPAASGS